MTNFGVLEKDECFVDVDNATFVRFYEFLNQDPLKNFISYTEKICFEKLENKFHASEDIPRLKWMILLKIIPIKTFNMPLKRCLQEIKLLLNEERASYYSSFKKYQLDINKITSMDPSKFHPLSQNADNPWNEQHRNTELLDEIWKDIIRTFSDRELFSKTNTRQLLQKVLFTWTRENPDFGYKQGMNELVAILFLINKSQRTKTSNSELSSNDKEDNYKDVSQDLTCKDYDFESIFEETTIEADTYIMFKYMMDVFGIKYMFQASTLNESKISNEQKQSKSDSSIKHPIIYRCIHIYKLLETRDHELYSHLYEEHEIEPQIIFLRWIRLLFSREFLNLNNSLIIWEYLFCDALQNGDFNENEHFDFEFNFDIEKKGNNNELICNSVEARMPIVNFVAISILILQRDLILGSDYNQTLKFIVNQCNLAIDPKLIIQKARLYRHSPTDSDFQLNSDKSHREISNIINNKSQIQRNGFFQHRDIHYSEIKSNIILNNESFKISKINEALLEIIRNLHISAKNINNLELLKNNVVSSCKELLKIRKLLQDRDI